MRRSDPASEICTQSQRNSIMCSLRSGSGQGGSATNSAGFYSKKAALVELYHPPASDQSKKDLKVKSLQNHHTWPSTFPLNLRRVRARNLQLFNIHRKESNLSREAKEFLLFALPLSIVPCYPRASWSTTMRGKKDPKTDFCLHTSQRTSQCCCVMTARTD